ncbi:MAG TPA: hypothetical protein PLE61_01455 [Vicinamibacterales bacterium]|nr:hypothetical protein [Vicinamibacterales bacterium]HPW19453.1 hypothetical protein [Vicinamibacterales bacterium]
MTSRREFLKGVAAGMALIGSAPSATPFAAARPQGLSASDLPEGGAPAPLVPAHFPDRLHAFVWRNWPLVPAEVMARVVGASASQIRDLGRSMGLGDQPAISLDQQMRSRLTVIRRNWHLLPYAQLLDVLGWTAEQLDYALREDDFLFIKLGRLKPRCGPLRYAPPGRAAAERAREIARVLRDECPADSPEGADPLFGFVSRLSRKPAAAEPADRRAPGDGLRFCYSYFALYGDPLLDPEPDPYPDGYLARLAQAGVNGIWLQAVLYKLAPFPWEPQRSAGYRTRLENLRTLVDRAARHGIRVLLYLNEPRTMPERFFEGRPGLKGVSSGGYAALCTSVPEVQRYLADSVASIGRAVPELGGFFSITASENPTNCWSHGAGAACPRCGARSPAEVIAEVNCLFAEGIRASGSAARLIAWDWGWNDAWAGDAIGRLAAGTALMSVSEWRLPIERGGVTTEVGEYSISAVGPGPRARAHWNAAAGHKLETVAKIQAGNTWELSSVPYIPAVENVARHAARIRESGVSGVMLGWTLGGCPSPNLEVVSEALACGSADEAMSRVARRRFGPRLGPLVVEAWRRFSAAFSEYPYHGEVLYNGPQQLGPANLLWGEPTNYRATMTGFPYDDLDAWRAVYPPDVFIRQFDKMADGFDSALAELRLSAREAARAASASEREALAEEERVAEAAAIHFRSTANQARFVLARRNVAEAKAPPEAAPHLDALERVLEDEIALARRLRRIQLSDSRFGFEASNQYFYVPVDLQEKILNCRDLLTRWLPQLRAAAGAVPAAE